MYMRSESENWADIEADGGRGGMYRTKKEIVPYKSEAEMVCV